MNVKNVLNVDTRLDKSAKDATRTVLTMDYTGCTVEDLIAPAEDSLVIALQGRWRRAKAIPKTLTVNVKELIASLKTRAGGPETVESLAAKAATMSDEERQRIIALLTGGTAQPKPAQAARK